MNQIIKYLLARSRATKRLIVLTVDTFVCIASVWLAFYLRLGEAVGVAKPFLLAVAVSIALALPLFIRFGLYRAIFRYSGLPALMAVANATLFYGIAYAAVFTVWRSLSPSLIGHLAVKGEGCQTILTKIPEMKIAAAGILPALEVAASLGPP